MKNIIAALEAKRAAARAGRRRKAPWRPSTPRASSPRANASSCCSTKGRSKSSTCSSNTAATTSAWRKPKSQATASSPATARSTAAWSTCSPRTSPCSAARSRPRTPPRSCKVQDMAMKNGAPIVGIFDAGGARIQEGVEVARRLRRHLPAQHSWRQRRHPADQRHHGAVRGRRCVFAGDDRLHLHGEGHELHVRHWPRGRENGDQRSRHRTRNSAARACMRAKSGVVDGAYENDFETLTQMRRLIDFLPLSNREKPPTRPHYRRRHARGALARSPHPRQSEQALRHEGADREGRRRRRFLRDRRRVRQEHPHRLRAPRWLNRRASSPTSR